MNIFYERGLESEDQLREDLLLLHKIYPDLTRDQLLESKENLDRYFDNAVRIFLREQKANKEAEGEFDP